MVTVKDKRMSEPTIASRLLYFREGQLGLKQGELADALGVSRPLVAKYESGRGEPSRAYLQKLNELYGLRSDWVLTGELPMYRAGWNTKTAGLAEAIRIAESIIPRNHDALMRKARLIDAERFPDYAEDIEWVKIRPFDVDAMGAAPVAKPIYDTKALVSLPREWFEDRDIDPAQAGIMRCKDVQMSPTVPYDALVLVDFADTGLAIPGIHAVILDAELRIRRLVARGRDDAGALAGVTLSVEHAKSGPETLQGDGLERLTILGRVRAVISAVD